jgi:hypothetical protein
MIHGPSNIKYQVPDKITTQNKMIHLTSVFDTLWAYNGSKGSCSYFTDTNKKSSFDDADCVSESEFYSTFIVFIT